MIKYRFLVLAIILFIADAAFAQVVKTIDSTMIAGHKAIYDSKGKIQSWFDPGVPGAGYSHVMKTASRFIQSETPVDPGTGKKLYYISCCFQGPHMVSEQDFLDGKSWEHWPHNPACVFAGLTKSLVIDYRVYSGDEQYTDVVKEMLDYQLRNGTTPAGWGWSRVPFASSTPGDTIYRGATGWEEDGLRGDGINGIEPDKVGELGVSYLLFFEVTGDKKYLSAARDCANALASHVRDVNPEDKQFVSSNTSRSPWPFRVNAKDGTVISEYCSNVIEPIHLFDELIRLGKAVALTEQELEAYKKARKIAWRWLFSINGPMKTYIWNAYFEDVPNDPDHSNRLQITPMETARYLLEHPGMDPDLDTDIPALLNWVESVFGTKGMDAIKEQTWCFEPMGSHTARFASVCALWYRHSRDERFKEKAYRYFNLATYMCDDNGVVRVGPNWPETWFSDGYGDYIRHFYEGLVAVPEWSPAGEDHLLHSTSVVQTIMYNARSVSYRTFDNVSTETLSLKALPVSITVGDRSLKKGEEGTDYWSTVKLPNGNYKVSIHHTKGNKVEVKF